MNITKQFSLLILLFLLAGSAAFAQTSGPITITNIKQVNTAAIEFSPVFYHHGLVYVSSQYRHGRKDNNINENTFELLYADMSPLNKLSKPAPMSLEINTKFHEGPVSFNENMSEMFFTRNNLVNGNPVKDSNGKIQMQIYHATKGKADWENITSLPFNSNEYTCMHPSLSRDGKKLFFASDQPGGYGGMDIYYVEMKNGSWSTPVNLGAEINTNRSEAFPFIHPSGKLFFSSNQKMSMGGLDIFMVDVRDGKVGKVVGLPEPINSFQDDLGFMISNSGALAFFSSTRLTGAGKDDIYRAEIPGGLKGLFPPREEDLLITVKNRRTMEPIEGANLKVVPLESGKSAFSMKEYFGFTLEKNNDQLNVRYFVRDDFAKESNQLLSDANGMRKVPVMEDKKYIVLGAKDGFIANFVKTNSFTSGLNSVELLLTPVDKVPEVEPEPVEVAVGTVIILDQIYYDFDKSYIRTDASRGLSAILDLMTRYTGMTIDLTAHTDSRGERNYNQKLSEQRALSAKFYLTSRGIAENRIKTIGMGESNPRNGCRDGVRCSETEHQYNRRTEIKVTSLGAQDRIQYQENLPDYISTPRKRKN